VHRPEFGQGDPLAIARFGQDEQVGLTLDDAHTDNVVAHPGEPDADHTTGGPAHRADVGLGEPGDLALGGGDDDVVVAARDIHPGELVTRSMVMAMMPVERTRSNCSSGVFLTTPLRVARTR